MIITGARTNIGLSAYHWAMHLTPSVDIGLPCGKLGYIAARYLVSIYIFTLVEYCRIRSGLSSLIQLHNLALRVICDLP